MTFPEGFAAEDVSGLVLVVDDSQISRTAHRGLLAQQFDVISAASGEEALELCGQRMPDLILMDIEMPGLGGIETCRRLRESSCVPVIFATARESLDEHMHAYDAGGDDILVKPVQSEILRRKVALAIARHRWALSLKDEKDALQRMAMSFLSTAGNSGTLMNYMRTSTGCRSHADLAAELLKATDALGIDCSVMIQHDGGPTMLTYRGEPTSLEQSVLRQSAAMGRMFQFGQRLVVNYDRVSILVNNMPDEAGEPARVGELRDNITILAETTEALCENVDARIESMQRAEQLQVALGKAVGAVEALRGSYLRITGDTQWLLEKLVEKIERAYAWAGFTEQQEAAMSAEIGESVRSILVLLSNGSDFERQFDQVLEALRGDNSDDNLELF